MPRPAVVMSRQDANDSVCAGAPCLDAPIVRGVPHERKIVRMDSTDLYSVAVARVMLARQAWATPGSQRSLRCWNPTLEGYGPLSQICW